MVQCVYKMNFYGTSDVEVVEYIAKSVICGVYERGVVIFADRVTRKWRDREKKRRYK